MTKDISIIKLFRVDIKSINDLPSNWFRASFLVKVSEGNILLSGSCFHKSFWMKEFNLTEEEFNALIAK